MTPIRGLDWMQPMSYQTDITSFVNIDKHVAKVIFRCADTSTHHYCHYHPTDTEYLCLQHCTTAIKTYKSHSNNHV